MLRSLGFGLAFLLLGIGGFVPQAQAQDARSIIADTVLTGENGQAVRLGDYRGKVVLVYFWASWCPH